MVSWIKAFVRGIEISDETLALDLVAQYRDQGPYLESEHTRRNFRRRWYPDLFERADYETWLARGGQDLGQRAATRVQELLEEHQPEPLPRDLLQQLQDVIARAAER